MLAAALAATFVCVPPGIAQFPVRLGPETALTASDLRTSKAENSPMLAVDPTEPNFVAAATRIDAEDYGCALQVSGSTGKGWVPANPVPSLPEGAEKCYAPEVAFDRSGRLYYLFVGLAGIGNRPMGVFLTTSDDRASRFSTPKKVLGAESFMVRLVIDQARGTHGRIHIVWLAANTAPPLGGLPAGDNPILAMYSDDRGGSFSTPVRVSDAGRLRAVAPAVVVGPDHSMHVAYYDLGDDARDYQGLEGPVWDGQWSLVVARSNDAGQSFEPGAVVDDEIAPPERVILIFTMPAPAFATDDQEQLFLAWPDARFGDADVLLRRSTDGGRSWAPVQRLNDDPLGNGRSQYLPRLSAAFGRIDAVFYDRREDPKNLRAGVSYTTSNDGGTTFSPNVALAKELSDTRTGPRYGHPAARGLVEFGSRLGLLSGPDWALAAWTDTRNSGEGADALSGPSEQDILARRIELPGSAPAVAPEADEPTSPWLGYGVSALVLVVAVVVVVRRWSSASLPSSRSSRR